MRNKKSPDFSFRRRVVYFNHAEKWINQRPKPLTSCGVERQKLFICTPPAIDFYYFKDDYLQEQIKVISFIDRTVL
jgi:hypothetical protein